MIRDLNNSWSATCDAYLRLGAEVLATADVAIDHQSARDALRSYLDASDLKDAAAASLILDAVTIHDTEAARLGRTLV